MIRQTRWTVIGSLVMVIALAGCDRSVPGTPSPSPTQSSPATDAEATFEMEGTVVEASGSASATNVQAPSPLQSPARKSSPASPVPSPSPTAETGANIIIERGAPGSLAIKVQRYSAAGSPCRFAENDILVLAFTTGTDFQPSELTLKESFPNNLTGAVVQITGRIEEENQECLLIAKTVRVGNTAASPEPTKSPARNRTSPSASPTSASPSPSA